MPYKWIKHEIESLDPNVDYEKIWRLSASYDVNDFILNLGYALSVPNTLLPEHGSRPIWRKDGGKLVNKANNRVTQTVQFLIILAWYGPAHPKSIEEVDRVNRLHNYWSEKYPMEFSSPEGYIYPICLFATQKHQLFVRLGLSGLSEKEKIAAHHFWRDIYGLMRIPRGKPLDEFPKTWDGMLNAVDEWDSRYSQGTDQARLATEAIYAQFSQRFFPPGLHWLARYLILALAPPRTLRALCIPPVYTPVVWLLRLVVRLYLVFVTNILPDPKVAYWEIQEKESESERLRKGMRYQELDRTFPAVFTNLIEQQGLACPFLPRPDAEE